jgi:hypothetical protein
MMLILKSTFFWEHYVFWRGPDVSEGYSAPHVQSQSVSQARKQQKLAVPPNYMAFELRKIYCSYY